MNQRRAFALVAALCGTTGLFALAGEKPASRGLSARVRSASPSVRAVSRRIALASAAVEGGPVTPAAADTRAVEEGLASSGLGGSGAGPGVEPATRDEPPRPSAAQQTDGPAPTLADADPDRLLRAIQGAQAQEDTVAAALRRIVCGSYPAAVRLAALEALDGAGRESQIEEEARCGVYAAYEQWAGSLP